MDVGQEDSLAVEHRYGWFMVVLASVLMGMGAGALISISAFLKPLIAEFGWLRGETSFGYLAGALAMGIGGIVMGHLSDRYSTRWVVLGGLICLGVSLLLLSTQSSLWQFYLFYCLMGGFGSSSLDVPLLVNIGHWFDRNKGLAIGLTTAGRALGQGFVPFLSGYMIASSGWRDAYTTLGLVTLVLLVPLALLVKNPPGFEEARTASRDTSPADHDEAYPLPPKLAVSWIGVASIFCCACMGTAMVHAIAIAQDAGLGAEDAAAVILLIYVSGFFGRIFFGKLADHIGGIRSYWLSSFGQTVFIFWFSQMQSIAGFYTLAVAFGFFFGGVMTALTVCVRELTPVHMRGIATGVVFFLAWVGMGIGGYQGGVFFDLSGSYVLSYANATIVGVINLMIVGALYVYVMRLKTAPA